VIKASAFTDNAVGLIPTTGPAIERLAAKYGPLVPPSASSSCARIRRWTPTSKR